MDEAVGKFPYQIYCDMDGVLVDLTEGVVDTLCSENMDEDLRAAAIQAVESGVMWRDLIKREKKYPELSLGTKKIFELISHNTDFWTNLPLKNDSQQLWNFISSLKTAPCVLSAPWDEESRKGKIMWLSALAENLNPVPAKDKIILTHKKHTYAVNSETGQPNILIDDMDKYLLPWKEAGGIAIKHISTTNTIEELKKWLD